MVAPAKLQGASVHVEVDDLGRTSGQCCNRKAAAVGKEVEHALARSALANQFAACCHVREKSDVLCLAETQAKRETRFPGFYIFRHWPVQQAAWSIGKEA